MLNNKKLKSMELWLYHLPYSEHTLSVLASSLVWQQDSYSITKWHIQYITTSKEEIYLFLKIKFLIEIYIQKSLCVISMQLDTFSQT